MSDQYLNLQGVSKLWDKTKGKLERLSNPNILINADFRKPVNRNGKTVYTQADVYNLDLWLRFTTSVNHNFEVIVQDGYITLKPTITVSEAGGNIYPGIRQNIYPPEKYQGLSITFSILYKTRNLVDCRMEMKTNHGTISNTKLVNSENWNLTVLQATVPSGDVTSLFADIVFYTPSTTDQEVDILACKVELGDQQTLAHQETDGSWELNDPIDYETEYAKCAQYNPKTGVWVGYVDSSIVSNIANAPIGAIVAWSGTANNIPDGWHICNGQDGTVDLRDKFVLGAGTNHPVGETGGEEGVVLTSAQMPAHSHVQRFAKDGDTVSYYQVRSASESESGATSGYAVVSSAVRVTTGITIGTNSSGGSGRHNNMPPYYTLLFIQKISESQTDYTTKEYVDEKSKQVYSEGETQIGTWIDGQPLYRKVIPITLPSAIATSSTIIGTMGTGCNVVKADGWWKSSSNAVQQIGHYASLSTRTVFGYWHINADGSIRIIFNNSDMLNKEGWFVVEYIKTTELTQLSEDGEVTSIDYNREDLE